MFRTIGEMFSQTAQENGAVQAILDPHRKPASELTYQQLLDEVRSFAAGLQGLGIRKGDRVALLSDNRPRWLISDQALLSFGAIDVPRGSDTATQEIWYIITHSEATALIVQDRKLFQRIAETITPEISLRTVILMDDTAKGISPLPGVRIENFIDIVTAGREAIAGGTIPPPEVSPDDLATIVYTSGTTGIPKGVMLTHANLTHQSDNIEVGVDFRPGDRAIAILPTWHVYERAVEYFLLKRGVTLIYSDKRYLREDLQTYKPQVLPCVPRMWESIYDAIYDKLKKESPGKQKFVKAAVTASLKYIKARRIANGTEPRREPPDGSEQMKARVTMLANMFMHWVGDTVIYSKMRAVTGGNLVAAISGGGSLAPYLDDFFEAIGIPILNGYGLTETSPVLTCRTVNHNIRGSVGPPIPQIKLQIRDEHGNPLAPASTGVIWAKGVGVMKGYYKNSEATAKVIDRDGWFNTGDLGWITYQGDLVISGRAKDTIVLSSGENVEPEPIESAALQSPLIGQIMVVGQDQKVLAALVTPNFPALAEKMGLPKETSPDKLVSDEKALKVVKDAVSALTAKRFKPHEQITRFALLTEPFSEANGMLTQTMKLKRNVILKNHASTIESLFSKS